MVEKSRSKAILELKRLSLWYKENKQLLKRLRTPLIPTVAVIKRTLLRSSYHPCYLPGTRCVLRPGVKLYCYRPKSQATRKKKKLAHTKGRHTEDLEHLCGVKGRLFIRYMAFYTVKCTLDAIVPLEVSDVELFQKKVEHKLNKKYLFSLVFAPPLPRSSPKIV